MANAIAETTPFLNFNRICRLCIHEELDLLPIFESRIGGYLIVSLIQKCVGLEVSKEDVLPKQICRKCYQHIDNWLKFKELCENSNELLFQYYTNPQPLNTEVLLHITSPCGDPTIPDDLSDLCPQNLLDHQSFLKALENEQTIDFWAKNFNVEMEKLDKTSNDLTASKIINILNENTGVMDSIDRLIPASKTDYLIESFGYSAPFNNKLNICSDAINISEVPNLSFTSGKNDRTSSTNVENITLNQNYVPNLAEIINQPGEHNTMTEPIRRKGKGITAKDCLFNINIKESEKKSSSPEKRALFLKKYFKFSAIKYLCGIENCDNISTRFCDLLDHDAQKHSDLPLDFCCEKCNKCFISQLRLDTHYSTKHVTQTFACALCNKNFVSRRSLRTHLVQHEKKYVCDICGASKHCKASLIDHMNSHSKKKLFKCDICSATFSTSTSKRRHIKSIHSNIKMFKCDQCDYRTGIRDNLTYHKNSKHNTEKFICSECGNTYSIYSVFLQHLKSHHNRFTCNICDKVFNKRHNLKRHEKSHFK